VTRSLLAACLTALACCAGAAAHVVPQGASSPYVSTVKRILPPAPGVFVAIMGFDDQVWLENTGPPLIVLGYRREPYLLFDRTGVYENDRSPATYLNRDRYGKLAVPSAARPGARPKWRRLTGGDAYNWHDHRIHWMSPIAPPVVRARSSKPHHIFDWQIPIRVGDTDHVILGSLDYTPTRDSDLVAKIAVGAAIALTAVAAVLVLIALRLRRRSTGVEPRAGR
jgi:hypothetical protein